MQRLKTRAQYEAAMAGGTVSRTAHFVLHRAALVAPAQAGAQGEALESRLRGNDKPLFAVHDEPWMGAVVPKRWAKRAVTRNGIKRQIYAVSAEFATRLPSAAHVVRLKLEFARAQFPSAWSDALKATVRGELQQLFAKAALPVIPAQAGTQGPPAGTQGAPTGTQGAPAGTQGTPAGIQGAPAGTQAPRLVIPAKAGIQESGR